MYEPNTEMQRDALLVFCDEMMQALQFVYFSLVMFNSLVIQFMFAQVCIFAYLIDIFKIKLSKWKIDSLPMYFDLILL